MANQSKPHLHHSGAWRTRISGKEIWLGRDKAAAFRRFAELIAKTPTATRRLGTVSEVVDAYRATASPWTRRQLDDFLVWLGAATIEQSPDSLAGYVSALRDKGNAPKTIRHKVYAALAALRWAAERGIIAKPPKPTKLKKPPRVARDIDPAVLAAVFATIPRRARAILSFIAETGCRPSEACGLKWSMQRGATFVLPKHKAAHKGQTRTIYLTPAAQAIIDALPLAGEFVFLSRLATPYTATGLRSILRRRGINSTYALRHTFAQVASERVPVDVLAKLMGHADASTTARFYYEVRNERAASAAKALSAIVPPGAPSQPQPTIEVRDDRRAGAASKRRRCNTSDARETSSRPPGAAQSEPRADSPGRLRSG